MKNTIYTELYFNKFDPKIVKKLENCQVWNYLLINNEIDLLKKWININYGNETEEIDDKNNLKQVFGNLNITLDMISSVENSNVMIPVSQTILNYLCR